MGGLISADGAANEIASVTDGEKNNLLRDVNSDVSVHADSSLKAEDGISLDTISGTIHLIHTRDAKRKRRRANTNPWRLGLFGHSPMMSYHRAIPEVRERQEDQRWICEREEKSVDEMNQSPISIVDEIVFSKSNHLVEENGLLHMIVHDEHRDQKRIENIHRIIHSTSALSMNHMNESQRILSEEENNNYSPSTRMVNSIRKEFAKNSNPLSMSILYGFVNTVIILPILISFGNIIYRDQFFRPYLPVLIKLTIVSGFVHQVCFSTFSTLPFSVGQVQDAGLIFLSSMASGIVDYCQIRGHTDEEILATTVIGLSIFTTILGLSLYIIGRLKLAGYIRSLPTAVIGGYLAYIGFFCGQSGLSLMSGVGVSSFLQWKESFFQGRALQLVLPGLIGGITIYAFVRKIKHMIVLPTCIVILFMLFYGFSSMVGYSLDAARNDGWINQSNEPPIWYKTWDYFKFDKVIWSALPGQTLTLLSMICVVALSSSLDIAAIDLETSKPLEYNYELRMIGLSNIISGLTGGYTGSYIFSQTIFSLRAGIRSRTSGYIIALCELITVVIPVSILDYVPNFIFGSLLIVICVDLMIEWLWDVRRKLTNAAYAVALSTFVLIQIVGIECGILAGVGIHILLAKLGFNVDDISMVEAQNSAGNDQSVSYLHSHDSDLSLATDDGYGTFIEKDLYSVEKYQDEKEVCSQL